MALGGGVPGSRHLERREEVAAFAAWQRLQGRASVAPPPVVGRRPLVRQDFVTMTNRTMENDPPRVLSANAFAFELDAELRRAARVRSRVTLVVMETRHDSEEPASNTVVQEVAGMIDSGVRDTDLLGYTEAGTLSLALLDSDFERSIPVINRLIARMEKQPSATTVRIAIGAACYPNHAVDVDSLKREALSRPVATCRSGFGAAGGQL